MCGITGFLSKDQFPPFDKSKNVIDLMTESLFNRGPDSGGTWVDQQRGIAFGHRRLAILDVSEAGNQPMHSRSGRYVMSYNGEIYNHLELRRSLEKENTNLNWNGSSDTETILSAFEVWGIKKSLKKFKGMFAIALFDKRLNQFSLMRDRVGEKPLYYGWQNNTFFFSSDLASLKLHPDFDREIDRDIIPLYLRHSYIPTPFSIYKGIKKLIPGSLIQMDLNSIHAGKTSEPEPYWSLDNVIENGLQNPITANESEAINLVDSTLSDAIRNQMISDVPLGAFLSGGVDSSLITSLMQVQSSSKIQTFSIGFQDPKYDEAKYAKEVANHLGTDHNELYLDSHSVADVIPNLASYYTEPFADSSQIPTFLVSEMARSKVTVSLSGDAGDELFGGYNRYFWASKIWKKLKHMPGAMRIPIARIITSFPPELWEKFFSLITGILPSEMRVNSPGEKIYKLAHILDSKSKEEIYLNLISLWKIPPVKDKKNSLSSVLDIHKFPDSLNSFESKMMYLDTLSYLPDDILTKVDRAAMAVSLETRIPFLDVDVIELAWSLPLNMKIRGDQGKWILRKVLDKYVPRKLIDRPKQGFGIPIGELLRDPLRDWAENLLDASKLKEQNIFDHEEIRLKWEQHLSGDINWQHQLWSVLMFQGWLEIEEKN